jgi:hypothetical protein
MRSGRQADRGHVAESGERGGRQWKRIDQDDALRAGYRVGRAEEVNPVVMQTPPPDSGHSFRYAVRDDLRLAHGRLS